MKKKSHIINVAIKPYYGKVFLDGRVFAINNGHNIFFKYDKVLRKYGIKIFTIDQVKDIYIDKYIYCDAPYFWEVNYWFQILKHRNKNICFSFEPPLINPITSFRFISFLFKSVYTWNNNLAGKYRFKKFYFPQLDKPNLYHKTKQDKRKKLLVLINSNKKSILAFRLLAGKTIDLYQERVKAIKYFVKKSPKDLDLYGKNWNQAKFALPVYRGEAPYEKKIKILSKYKFCLCFENSVVNGYVSEKIFDCFRAGCIPVYYGDPNIDQCVNPNCYIDFRRFSSYEELYVFLKKITKLQYLKYIKNIDKFINSRRYQEIWSEKAFLNFFIKIIKN